MENAAMSTHPDPTIGAEELAARLGDPGLLVVDTRDEADFRAATIPGAVSLDVYAYFIPASDAAGVADLDAAACAAMRAIGADHAVATVFFEAQTGMISPRGLWFHEYAGLAGGRVLDGGFAAYQALGGPVGPGTGEHHAMGTGAAPSSMPTRRTLLATIDDIVGRDPARTVLLDVRRRSEHEGSFVHPCCARPGRIPGSLFLFWEDLLANGAYREAANIASRAAAVGLRAEQDVIVYCHRGARAATALYALRRAGFPHVRVFVGSWHEWAERADLPALCGAGTEA